MSILSYGAADVGPKKSILVVDDDDLLRANLVDWLSVCGYAAVAVPDGATALGRARREPFDLVITDLRMPGMTGLELIPELKRLQPSTEIIVLSGHATVPDAIAALRGGQAFDFLLKPLQDLDLLSATINRALGKQTARPAEQPPGGLALGEGLTDRERDILGLLAEGLENREIADRLNLKEKTVRNYLTTLYAKLGVTSRTKALLRLQQGNLP